MFRIRDGVLSRMVEVPYEAENILQQLLADYPGLLAGDSEETESDWLLIEREIGIAESEDGGTRWSLDHLFVDRDAVPTLVEVKRSSDSRIRREVVGQMLDYAANGSAVWSQESIRASFESASSRDGKDPESELESFLGGGEDPDEFWNKVGENLKLGKLRLVFVADEIPRELRRVIEFLNEQMESTEVIGIEVKQFAEEGGEATTLMSSVIGRTETSRQVKGVSSPAVREPWSVDEFESRLRDDYPPDLGARAVELHRALVRAGASLFPGRGPTEPSMNYWFSSGSPAAVSLSMYMNGLAINFDWVRPYRSDSEMERLAELAARIPGSEPYLGKPRRGIWNVRPGLRYGDILVDDDSPELIASLMLEASKPVEKQTKE
ncbi:MAG: hypothetical protein BGO23_03210 [Solirubrobacterales bacterium 67-14]|nr:MAG: hypothetical protein BGO23_03210 [Solirubrobacterales bacterium 67-14]